MKKIIDVPYWIGDTVYIVATCSDMNVSYRWRDECECRLENICNAVDCEKDDFHIFETKIDRIIIGSKVELYTECSEFAVTDGIDCFADKTKAIEVCDEKNKESEKFAQDFVKFCEKMSGENLN